MGLVWTVAVYKEKPELNQYYILQIICNFIYASVIRNTLSAGPLITFMKSFLSL